MKTNKILENHGEWLLLDISTPKFLTATMAVDTDLFMEYTGGRFSAWANDTSKYIYSQSRVDGSVITTHRLVLRCAPPMSVDHINHGTMAFIDNRRCNLRIASKVQNNMNVGIRSNNTSGATGVCSRGKKWMARITVDGKRKRLGLFSDYSEAVDARKKAEIKYYGEYRYGPS